MPSSFSTFRYAMHCPVSSQFAPVTNSGESVPSVTGQNFCGYLLVPGTQLNKQQFTTTKVSVGQSWKANWGTPDLGRVGRAS